MRARNLLACGYLLSASVATAIALSSNFANVTDPSSACQTFKTSYPNITFLPEDSGYMDENQVSWSTTAWLGPACIFAPASAQQLAYAVKTLVKDRTLFAIRGGGHMPISNAANINSSGILISSTNLDTLLLSEDKGTVSIGPAKRWGDVFDYLDGTNLTIVGGRLGAVGVPGLILGGGVSFYSYANGFASTNGNLRGVECVLADGTIVTATATNEYSDLFWALQGGGNSFCLATRFDLKTFYAPTPLLAEASYGSSNTIKVAYLDAITRFATEGDEDIRAAITPVARWGPNYTSPEYESTLFYNGTVAPTTGPFTAFLNGTLTPNGTALSPITLAEYSSLVRPEFNPGGASYGLRQRFHVTSTVATRQALEVVHDTYFGALNASGIANRVSEFFTGLAINPITRTFSEKSQGGPHGLVAQPAFWIEQSVTWADAADDATVEQFVITVNQELQKKLMVINATSTFVYLNDADKGQSVFATYGEKNLNKLKAIRKKYDPKRVFTDLLPGGFKVENA